MERKRATIYDLKPDPAYECAPWQSVYEAAQLMVKQRIHCVVVREGDGGNNGSLSGLITAKDLAFRVVSAGRNPHTTLVREIMTSSPLCLHKDTPITEALAVMVERRVRHLPLIDDAGEVQGVLDITRCFHQAMVRLERIAQNAVQLNAVLKEVAQDYEDLGTRSTNTIAAQRVVGDIGNLKKLIEVPTLRDVIDSFGLAPPTYVDSNAKVADAARFMVEQNTTALLVRDNTSASRRVIGIFTSKDIAFRVLARDLDPQTCTVARVLTTSPEFAKPSLSVGSALRLMYQGHFLNLPVMDERGTEIIAVVHVLQLTYTTLSQLAKRDEFDKEAFDSSTLDEVTSRLTEDTGPVWDRFWDSLDKSSDNIQALSSSVLRNSPSHSRSHTPPVPLTSSASRRASLNQMIISNSRRTSMTSAAPITPTASRRFSDDYNNLDASVQKFRRAASTESVSRTSFYLKRRSIVFKIRLSSSNSNRTHKISMTINEGVSMYDDIQLLELLKAEIFERLELRGDLSKDYDLFYYNEEDDLMMVETETDLIAAINHFEKQDTANAVELFVKDKSNNGGIFQSISNFTSSILSFIKNVTTSPASLVTCGTLAFLSVGVLVGITLTRKKLYI